MAEARSGVRRTATLPHGEANILPRGRVRRALLGPSKGSTCASLGANHGVNAPFASILRLREKNPEPCQRFQARFHSGRGRHCRGHTPGSGFGVSRKAPSAMKRGKQDLTKSMQSC